MPSALSHQPWRVVRTNRGRRLQTAAPPGSFSAMLKTIVALFCAALLFATSVAAQPPAAAPVTAIRAGRLLDTEAGRILTNQIILVEGTRIRDVGPNVA